MEKETDLLKKTMLVVDDQEINRDIMGDLFKNDFTILYAGDGEEALEILKSNPNDIDIVILDLIMPKKNVYAVLDEMNKDSELAKIAVIVVTGSEDIDSEVASLEFGATYFLTKPIKPYIAKLRVKNILEKQEINKLKTENAMLEKQHAEEQIYLSLITQSKNEYQYLVEYDQLTGIYNHHSFCNAITQEKKKNKNTDYVLIRLDIEKFKVINDIFGYDKGNEILCYIANHLKEIAGEDAIVARLEADNFGVYFKHDEKRVNKFLKDITDLINKFEIDFELVFSAGICVVKENNINADLLIDRAVLAQTTVKGNYLKRSCYYNDDMRKKILEEQEIVSQMNTALQEHQFKVFLQPKCDLATGNIIGAEALVRWMHPEKGMISPGKFIPVFEKNAFIMKLDEYIWEETCIIIRNWLDQGIKVLPISVNISRVNLYNPDLCKTIVALVKKYNIPTDLFELEITESAYTENGNKLLEVLNVFHEEKFTVLMDDFGSGYSSLNMLKNIPVDVLKIDLNFLAGTDELNRGKTIMNSIVKMSDNLEIKNIVEGVETKEQADFLISIGCAHAQGYLIYKPMPVLDFENICYKKAN